MNITMEELLRCYAAGERDFTGLKLPGADLRFQRIPYGVILKKANLSGACLEETIIQAVDLSGANLKKTRLSETNFNETILERADFRGAFLLQTSFYKCNLRHANFSGAVLDETSFWEVDLSYANFSGDRKFDIRCEDTIFHETIMTDGSLYSDTPPDREKNYGC